jgi:putative tryptophan/tyrosine transport system substrate-binding protein
MRRRKFISMLGGAVVGGPIAAMGQQPSTPVIGFMSGRAPEDSEHLVAAFRQGLSEAGFIEGQNVAIEFRWARGRYDLLPALASELLSSKVALLAAVGGDPSAQAAKQAAASVPIVFGIGGDPVASGLVESLGRPGGNLTGYTLITAEMEPKRLGLLSELLPGVTLFGALINPNFGPAAVQAKELEAAAQTIGKRLFVSKASNDAELSTAFSTLIEQRVGALLVAADPYFDTQRDHLVAFATRNRLPTMYHFREFAVAGGLISYGPSSTDLYRQAGIYAGRILKGAKPADMPIVQPTKFEFVINLKAAKVLGLDIPPMLLARADEVIE